MVVQLHASQRGSSAVRAHARAVGGGQDIFNEALQWLHPLNPTGTKPPRQRPRPPKTEARAAPYINISNWNRKG